MKEQLPPAVRELIASPAWKGGSLVKLQNELSRPSAAEVALHYHWLKPWTVAMPTRVPSAFMVTDTLLILNELFDKRLFPVQDAADSVMQKAASEAVKVKKLLQALRYLYRASRLDCSLVHDSAFTCHFLSRNKSCTVNLRFLQSISQDLGFEIKACKEAQEGAFII